MGGGVLVLKSIQTKELLGHGCLCILGLAVCSFILLGCEGSDGKSLANNIQFEESSCAARQSGGLRAADIDGFQQIPSGCFWMGSASNDYGRKADESLHMVDISYDFYMQTHEVTLREWRLLMGNNPGQVNICEDCPVQGVSWYSALAYANAFSKKKGVEQCYDLSSCQGTPGLWDYLCDDEDLSPALSCIGYRLPTEAEWEYAARAGATHTSELGHSKPNDSKTTSLSELAWCGGARARQRDYPYPVKQKKPNDFGLYDMLGNSFEPVWDWYGDYPRGRSKNPVGPTQGEKRVIRGGDWRRATPEQCRAATRVALHPARPLFGIRLARTIGGTSDSMPPRGQVETTDGDGVDDGSQNLFDNENAHKTQQFQWSLIASGGFWMGAGETELRRASNESLHFVHITHAFIMQNSETTQSQWYQLMGTNPSYFDQCGGDCPVDSVSFYDALAFANELSEKQGLELCYDLSLCSGKPGLDFQCPPSSISFSPSCLGYRLPTEAEWEYAASTASAGHLSERPDAFLGSAPGKDGAYEFWAFSNSEVDYPGAAVCLSSGGRPFSCGPHPVATSLINSWGIYDLLGNLHEWTWDYYSDKLIQSQVDPVGAASGPGRVIRGGGWNSSAGACRSASRAWRPASGKYRDLGFRLVRHLGDTYSPTDLTPESPDATSFTGRNSVSELKKNTDVDESLGHLKLLLGCKVIAIKRILFEFDGELDWEEGPIVFLSKEEVWLLEDIRGGEEIKVTRVASDNARYCSRIAEVDEGYGRWTDVDVGCVEGYRDMIGN